MITPTEILDALRRELLAAWPKAAAIYQELVPKDFVRPSFLMITGPRQLADSTRWTISVTASMGVNCLPTLDDHGLAQGEELLEMVAAVEEILARGALRVGDRFLHLEKIDGESEWEMGRVNFSLRYADDRPRTEESLPMMTDLALQIGETKEE